VVCVTSDETRWTECFLWFDYVVEFFWFLASSESTKMSTPLLEYLKMKRTSRGRPLSSVSVVDEYIISRISHSDGRIWLERSIFALWLVCSYTSYPARDLWFEQLRVQDIYTRFISFWYASVHITQVSQAIVCILMRCSHADMLFTGETKSESDNQICCWSVPKGYNIIHSTDSWYCIHIRSVTWYHDG